MPTEPTDIGRCRQIFIFKQLFELRARLSSHQAAAQRALKTPAWRESGQSLPAALVPARPSPRLPRLPRPGCGRTCSARRRLRDHALTTRRKSPQHRDRGPFAQMSARKFKDSANGSPPASRRCNIPGPRQSAHLTQKPPPLQTATWGHGGGAAWENNPQASAMRPCSRACTACLSIGLLIDKTTILYPKVYAFIANSGTMLYHEFAFLGWFLAILQIRNVIIHSGE